ncbi:MAG: nucleotide exchange factor GrpE [Treponema sp.]|nr:nucleotide exchange factor GrpE [Treponema sp.]
MSRHESQNEQPDVVPSEEGLSQADNGAAEPGVNEQENTATPEEKITELEIRLADKHDQLLRKAAEFENFRKRINQEKISAIEYANQSLLLDIIPVIDDFERAIQAGESGIQTCSAEYTSFLEGIKMIEKRLVNQLESKWGLKRFNSAGELFDPNLHEALMMEKSPDVNEATVQDDLIKGYMLKERVIRAAKVKVLMPDTEKA